LELETAGISSSGDVRTEIRPALPLPTGVGTCAAPLELRGSLGRVASGNLDGAPMQLASSCGGDGPEAVFAWTAPRTAQYSFDTVGSDFDTVLYLIFDAGVCPAPALDCNDDTTGALAQLEFALTAGERVFVVLDTYAFETGAFELRIDDLSGTGCEGLDLGNAVGTGVAEGRFGSLSGQRQSACGGSGNEQRFRWTAPEAGRFVVSTSGSNTDSVLAIYDGCGEDTWNCTGLPGDREGEVSFEVDAGQELWIGVDAAVPMEPNAMARYELNILPSR
jgi:hypothetical protein